MPESSTHTAIFKILSGLQAGSEVKLLPGEYVLGTDRQDDLQLIDVSISPHHAKLRISSGRIALAGLAGALRTASGLSIDPNGPFQDIEPLDVITAGTTRFALGYSTSQWSTVIEDVSGAGAVADHRSAEIGWVDRLRLLAIPIVALGLVVAFLVWLAVGAGMVPFGVQMQGDREDVAVTRAALDRFPFGRSVVIHQEADGTIYVTGYVDTPVERRALQAAVEKTGIPARIRLWVRQTIRSEVQSLIAAEKVPVVFQFSDAGVLTLDGVILNETRAARFVDLVKERVLGLSRVDSRIRTATSLLSEIERLADTAQIRSFVLLRIANDLVEVTGAIPAEKVDAFVGFLQSYARRFARDIPLRSFVQLQGATTSGVDRSILVGGIPSGADIRLDPEKMAEGIYETKDILPGGTEDGRRATQQGVAPGSGRRAPSTLGLQRGGSATGTAAGIPGPATAPDGSPPVSIPDVKPHQRAGSGLDTARGRPNRTNAADEADADPRSAAGDGPDAQPVRPDRMAASDHVDADPRNAAGSGPDAQHRPPDRTPAAAQADADPRSSAGNEPNAQHRPPNRTPTADQADTDPRSAAVSGPDTQHWPLDRTAAVEKADADPRSAAGNGPDTQHEPPGRAAAAGKADAEPHGRFSRGPTAGGAAKPDPAPSIRIGPARNATNAFAPDVSAATGVMGNDAITAERTATARSALRSAAQDLLRRWQADRLDGDPKDRAFKTALDNLRASDPPPQAGAAPTD